MQRFALDTVDSTNVEAKQLFAAKKIARSALITAREQTAGRGSRGRAWVSPRDAGMYMSVIDVPTASIRAADIEPTMFTLAAGVACVEVLRGRCGVDVGIKPVNDLFVEGRKLGGILTELIVEQETVQALVTGVGINTRSVNRPVEPSAAEPVALENLLPAHSYAHFDADATAEALARGILELSELVWRAENEKVKQRWESYLVPNGVA